MTAHPAEQVDEHLRRAGHHRRGRTVEGDLCGAACRIEVLRHMDRYAIGVLDDGSSFDLAQRKGSWVVLNFFTADCIPCQQEHPELVEFVEQQDGLGADGAEFYSVVVNDSPEDVEEFFDEYGGDWPIVYPADSSAIDVAFGVAAVPETWIIDPNGVVRVRVISTVDSEVLNVTMQQLREGAA